MRVCFGFCVKSKQGYDKVAGERFAPCFFNITEIRQKIKPESGQPVSEKYLQLGVDNAPIPALACPFFRDVHHRQIQHFQQAVIGREHGF